MTDTASISIGDLAAHLGVSRDLLYDQVRAGRLPVVLVSGHQRVRLEDVDDLRSQHDWRYRAPARCRTRAIGWSAGSAPVDIPDRQIRVGPPGVNRAKIIVWIRRPSVTFRAPTPCPRLSLAPIRIADETRALMIESLQWFHHQSRAWLDLIGDMRSGTLDAHRAAISSAAFRPNFHAARAAEYLEGEQWTEATIRYVQAAETLVRDVIMAALAEELGVELTSAERGTYWRRTARKLSEQAGVDLDRHEAWQAFGVVYAGRNTRFAHGHEEATIEDALQARSAWTQMRDLMQSLFAGSHGVSLDTLQQGALQACGAVLAGGTGRREEGVFGGQCCDR